LRIAVVRTNLHKGSGQTVHVRELTKRLLNKGLEVEVFSREAIGDISPAEVAD